MDKQSTMGMHTTYNSYVLVNKTLQKQIGCFNHSVVTLVAVKLKKTLVRLSIANSSSLLCGCYVIECIIFQIKPCNLCPMGIKYR